MPQLIVFPVFVRNEGSVCALLDDRSFMEHGDHVAKLAGGKAMADIDSCFVSGDIIEI